MNRTRITLALRLLLVGGVLAGAGALAAFTDSAVGETFATNGINLKIDSKGWYNGALVPSATWKLKDLTPGVDKFFNFDDIKPGDFGCEVISMHVKNQDAFMCLDFKNLKSYENGVNEPESILEPGGTGGELLLGTEFFGWMDDGDGTFEPPKEKVLFGQTEQSASIVLNDTTYPVGDSKYYGSCKKDTTRYVGMCWCAGNLAVNPTTGKMECDAHTLGNEAQTDSWTVDVAIRALPMKDNKSFLCKKKDDDHDDVCHHKDKDTEIVRMPKKETESYLKKNKHDYRIQNKEDEEKCEKEDKDKVKICHHTGSKTNPTEIIEVSPSAVSSHIENHADYVIKNSDDEKRCNDKKKQENENYGMWSPYVNQWNSFFKR